MDNLLERRALPEGWEWKRLGDMVVNEINGDWGLDPKIEAIGENVLVRVVRGTDFSKVEKGFFEDIPERLIKLKSVENKKLEHKDILIELSGGSVDQPTGRIALITKKVITSSEKLLLFSNFVKKLKVNEERINPDFFYWYWAHLYSSGKTIKYEKQTTGIRNFKYRDFLLREFIPLPPLSTQRRIVSILEKAEETKRLRAQADELTDGLLQSVFMEMFGDPVRNPMGWEVKVLEDVTNKIQIGPFGIQLHEEDYIEGGIPLINPTHISNKKIVVNINQTISKEKYLQLPNYHLGTGDVIMGRRGDMGRCALITQRENGWMCGTGSLFIRPNENLNSFYLLFLMSGNSMKAKLENDAQGVTMPNLNLTIVNKLEIPLPPFYLQQKFARIVEKIESMRQSQNQSKQQIEDLFSALMQKAFKGELVA